MAERRDESIEPKIRISGRLLRKASIWDEEWIEGGAVKNPDHLRAQVMESGGADILTFADFFNNAGPRQRLASLLENHAVARTNNFDTWWEQCVSQVTRKNVRRAEKRGVVTRLVEFDDALVQGITSIYNEVPIRQGRSFRHYGKAADTVRRENSSYLDRSFFVGAFCENRLIGFMKVVRVDDVGKIMQILSLEGHEDKRPTNALIAQAVRSCGERDLRYLVYGRFVYGNKETSPMTEFKRRNGFERLDYPRYFVPLTSRGSVAIRCRLHLGLGNLVPDAIISRALRVRAAYYNYKYRGNLKKMAAG
jgi:hypothetical protein